MKSKTKKILYGISTVIGAIIIFAFLFGNLQTAFISPVEDGHISDGTDSTYSHALGANFKISSSGSGSTTVSNAVSNGTIIPLGFAGGRTYDGGGRPGSNIICSEIREIRDSGTFVVSTRPELQNLQYGVYYNAIGTADLLVTYDSNSPWQETKTISVPITTECKLVNPNSCDKYESQGLRTGSLGLYFECKSSPQTIDYKCDPIGHNPTQSQNGVSAQYLNTCITGDCCKIDTGSTLNFNIEVLRTGTQCTSTQQSACSDTQVCSSSNTCVEKQAPATVSIQPYPYPTSTPTSTDTQKFIIFVYQNGQCLLKEVTETERLNIVDKVFTTQPDCDNYADTIRNTKRTDTADSTTSVSDKQSTLSDTNIKELSDTLAKENSTLFYILTISITVILIVVVIVVAIRKNRK